MILDTETRSQHGIETFRNERSEELDAHKSGRVWCGLIDPGASTTERPVSNMLPESALRLEQQDQQKTSRAAAVKRSLLFQSCFESWTTGCEGSCQ